MRRLIYLLIFFNLFCFGCTKNPEVDNLEFYINNTNDEVAETRVDRNHLNYNILPDPYALENMQGVFNDALGHNVITLSPTHLYVRFLPSNREELDLLLRNEELDLSPIPYDIDIEEEDEYIDNVVKADEYCWLYTTVECDFSFPHNIQYEIIRECYIPSDNEIIIATRGGEINVEHAAYMRSGYQPEIAVTASSNQYPSGTISVKYMIENEDGVIVGESEDPVRGVKVICRTFTKKASAYTDQNGNYVMNKKFYVDPKYKVVFRNQLGFTIWGDGRFMFPAQQIIGKQSKSGFSKVFTADDNAWDCCAINNAASDYYDFCNDSYILLPPVDLKIWAMNKIQASSAPMLRRISSNIITTWGDNLVEYILNDIYGSLITELVHTLHEVLPDIVIGTKNKSYDIIARSTFHELSHTSHFMQVGEEYWSKYIAYILSYGSYGDGTGINAELCGIGEMWGYTIGNLYRNTKFPQVVENTSFPQYISSNWIKPHVFWLLLNTEIMNIKQIYNCLLSDVETYEELINKMITKYPDKTQAVINAFRIYNLKSDDINEESVLFINNKIYDYTFTEYGDSVKASNFEVCSNVSLIFLFKNNVYMSSPFYISRNSRFEVRNLH